MRHLLILLALSLPASCGSGDNGSAPSTGSAPSAGFERAISELEVFKTRMCTCPDLACSEIVHAEVKAWRLALMVKLAGETRTKAQDDRGNALDAEIRACRKKLVAGSAAGSASPSSDHIERALAELERFRTRMCGCTDRSCSDPVHLEYKAWKRDLNANTGERPTKAQDDRGNAIDQDLRRCRKQAEAATPPSTTDKLEAALATMAALKTRMCACQDKPCGAQVDKEVAAWATRTASELAGVKSTPDQEARSEQIQSALAACKTALK
ncbi:MAG: hypothetical protein H6Q90_1230 [Deltaproteobacteria bacterium]|nr:hypothetical protein [Deltaproteobacteria bacterium]